MKFDIILEDRSLDWVNIRSFVSLGYCVGIVSNAYWSTSWTIRSLCNKSSPYYMYLVLWYIIRIIKKNLSCHDIIKCIGFSNIYLFRTSKVSHLFVVMITSAFGEIMLSIMRIITSPFVNEDSETLYSSFIRFHINTNSYWIEIDGLYQCHIPISYSKTNLKWQYFKMSPRTNIYRFC